MHVDQTQSLCQTAQELSGSVKAADPWGGERETSCYQRRRGGETDGALALRRMHAGHRQLLPDQV